MKSFTASRLKPYKGRIVLYLACVVLAVIFTMATALSVADFLRLLFEGADAGESAAAVASTPLEKGEDMLYSWLLGFGPKTALWLFSLLLLIVYGAKNVFGYLAAVQSSIIRSAVVADLRNDMHWKFMRMPMQRIDSGRKGDVLSRMSSDVAEYDESTLSSMESLVSSVVSIALYVAMLFYISAKLTFFVLAMLPIVIFVISGISRKLKKKSKKLQELHSTMLSTVEETLTGQKEIKAYVGEDYCQRQFLAMDGNYTKGRTNMFRRIYAASPISDTMGNGIVACILLFGSYLVFDDAGGMSPELFISYLMMVVLLLPPSKNLTTALATMKKGKACADRLEEMLNEKEEEGQDKGLEYAGLTDKIEIDHLNFSYAEEAVLNDICMTIPRGSTVALVGPSGSGKSTLADILTRQYPYWDGNIRVDGIELRDLRCDQWRSRIGVVSQHCWLFNGTIAENIAFGTQNATRQEIEQVAKAAGAWEFIEKLPEKLDAEIGDNGCRLSGGQRQRLCIARALLRNPDIMVLDEATSALDSESERLVQQSLDTAVKGRTVLMIAHRLSTVVGASKIFFLEKGRILEQGTHEELLAKGGRYADLCRLQNLEDFDKM